MSYTAVISEQIESENYGDWVKLNLNVRWLKIFPLTGNAGVGSMSRFLFSQLFISATYCIM